MRLREIKPGMVIHCKIEGEAEILCDNRGTCRGWKDFWKEYKERTCYEFNGTGNFDTYGPIEAYAGKKIVEFSDLIIPEMSAEELLQIVKEICNSSGCGDMCPLNEEGTGCLIRKTDFDPDKVLKVCEQWKIEHEKKEQEVEWIWQGRIYEIHDHNKGNFFQLKDGNGFYDTGCLNEESAEEYMAEVLKDYCKDHEGEFIAVVTRVCRVKQSVFAG